MIGKAAAGAHVNQMGLFGHFCGLDNILMWSVGSDMIMGEWFCFSLTPRWSQDGLV